MKPSLLSDLLPRAATLPEGSGGVVGLDGIHHGWGEIEELSRRLAGTLLDLGVRPGDRVALLHPKSVESFVAVHGVLRAGAVVVPLDPLGSAVPLASIVEQIEPSIVIGASDTLARLLAPVLARIGHRVISTGSLDSLTSAGVGIERISGWDEAVSASTRDHVLPTVEPADSAYVIFTSGSTGEPKGIVHSHASAMAYVDRAIDFHRLTSLDRLAGIPPLHFDMSTLELYGTPWVGATAITIGEAEQRFPVNLARRLESERVTHLYAVPFLLRQLQQRGAIEQRDLTALKHIGYAGEPFAPGALAELMAALPEVEVTNLYGPAETNVVTSHDLPAIPDGLDAVPIGRPWPDAEVRIVDDTGADVAAGIEGELLVSAPTCMVEYWRRPELTAERLHPHEQPGRPPWYATGDIVRIDPAGVLHYLGRRDHQVKIRGVRLELEGIEAVLTDAPGIEHAVVGPVVAPDGDRALAACLVMQPGVAFDQRAMRRWCAGRLPAVAVPTTFSLRTDLPTTASGKIDRAAIRDVLAVEAATLVDAKNEGNRI
jgi:amino acid adenylation domain-containing protein